ncbi:von Willebrand factor A domain-containing protein 5B1 isoform X1 [Phascolarctos cinereus]|uniref:von Willebrand factor A domain-containing protein 5B1 isoform X2 n=1 Tax=Phascolarctos cinereus TaxID=38626 RepID=A0A6P5J655_PHACI|nr:von Willebrand factor A domain-containing protein 5B1 isoform X2 [Phascolarctos cinereus]XP_020828843.1 von Willebrand factor A domain-containing protein 5B1 isoform X2 [Phascolarctos cinereus]
MPGLLNSSTWEPLPLTSSDITSCVQGYAFGLMASLTYGNVEVQPFQGLFVYPLDEYTTVVGFEAIISDRSVTVQIKDKAKLNSGYFDMNRPHNGKITLDEDLERTVFVANLGMIGPLESVSIFISTSSELQTLPSGAVRVLLPTVCVPPVPHSDNSISGQQPRGSKHIYVPKNFEYSSKSLCIAQLLDYEITNPMEYDFSFQLEIRGPCLLAGVESPTHEIRADAAPSACSAKSIIITLANKHTFDRPVEILIHPTEPHIPHILMEQGDMTQGQFEQHLKGRSDFTKGTKKIISAQRKMEIIRKRLHKDIPHHSVLMLNFCPDLQPTQSSLRKTHGEFIFLIDRSGSMSGSNINRVKDALVLILKSLMPTCLFNIIGFGSTFKTLFPSSQVYSEESLTAACENIQHLRADMGGTNILSPLKWVTRQPIHVGHPRLLFLLTDGSVSNTGKVLELIRSHAFTTRCYSFGIGPKACPRLVQGLAAVSKGSAEFLVQGERLQPKMIKSLKKAMAPVLSDVSVEWNFPESMEVLISPINSSSLFPGDRLVGYGIMCNCTYHPGSRVSHHHSAPGSQSSVFYYSQDKGSAPESGDCSEEALAFSASQKGQYTPVFIRDASLVQDHSVRRRAYSTNQIPELKSCLRTPTTSDSAIIAGNYLLRKTQGQDLLDHLAPEPCLWQAESQHSRCTSPELQPPRVVGSPRKSSSRPGYLSFPRWSEGQSRGPVKDQNQWDTVLSLKSSSSDSHSLGDQAPAQDPSCPFESELELEQESPSKGDASPQPMQKVRLGCPLASRPICKAVVKGITNNKPVQWEVVFDLGALNQELQIPDSIDNDSEYDCDLWRRTIHHLAAKAIIRDFEQLADKECEIEPGSGHRYQANAVHTSRACNVISKYTAFVPMDLKSRAYLPTMVEYTNTGSLSRSSSLSTSVMGKEKQKGLAINLKQAQFIFRQDLVTDGGLYSLNLDETNVSGSPPPNVRTERTSLQDRPLYKSLFNPGPSIKASETLFGTRLNLNTNRFLTRATRGLVSKPPAPTSQVQELPLDTENMDYLPLVSLQMASGAFLLSQAFCRATGIPMEKLKWTSPFTCHRVTLTSCSHSSSQNQDILPPEPKSPGLQRPNGAFQISAQSQLISNSSETFCRIPCAEPLLSTAENSLSHSPDPSHGADSKQALEIDGSEQAGKVWATAVALGWLENSSASYFVEWELVAAKASSWLEEQEVPEGRPLASVKTAAQQLFVLLRHWDENLEFNLLCYNPNSV